MTVSVLLGLLALAGPLPAAAAEPSPSRYGIEIEEAWIPMPDGVRLAADLYRPTGSERGARFPVLLEYLPYRKAEARGNRYSLFSYFVERGYVVARVDIRGTGNSEGRLIEHEYTEQEQRDGEAVIAWLAAQPFSSGKVGMLGISWGGFNSIHLAMRNPPALAAIVALMASDDLYQDDVHFIDGILHFDSYEVGQDVSNALPGAPEFVLSERFFRDRFDTKPWLLVYKGQQRDGLFWNRSSLNERYGSIRVPTFVIGGWYDGYRDSVPRMLENLRAPVKAIMGPWGHAWPHDAYPRPSIEWRREALRWFDHWLKGRETGILEEPRFAVYVRSWHPPEVPLEEAPGEWRYEDGWPLPRGLAWPLAARPDHSLGDPPSETASHELVYEPGSGIEAGGNVMWWGDFTPDQAPTDANSLIYDSPPLAEDVEILGFPRVRLNASATAPLAHWFVRLSDVAPDGRVTLVTGAGLNGAHRDSAERPEPLVPGQVYPLDVELHFTSWVFPEGHRVRLSVSNAQWPMFWPTPYPMTTSLRLGGEPPTRLELPIVPHADRPRPEFLPPAADAVLPGYRAREPGTISGYAELRGVARDERGGATQVVSQNRTANDYPWGSIEQHERIAHRTRDADPAHSSLAAEYGITVRLPARELAVTGTLDLRSDTGHLHFVYTRRLLLGGELVRERIWRESIPRDYQ